ncbi:MAG: glycerophosphodiester phosphodiesterase [Anaerolineae bacterium]
MSDHLPLIYGHRGVRFSAPENTMAAFRAAREAGADGVECDVSRCKTGEIMIMHDDTLNRTTNGKGALREHTFSELRQLDAGSWLSPSFSGEKLPALKELLDFAGSTLRINIEIKGMDKDDDGIERDIARMLRERHLQESIIISSFNPRALERMHAADQGLACALLYAREWPVHPDLDTALMQLHLRALHPEFRMVDGEYIKWAHSRKYLVNVWTVDEPEDMLKMIELGVDGIITDNPALLVKLLEGRR